MKALLMPTESNGESKVASRGMSTKRSPYQTADYWKGGRRPDQAFIRRGR